MQIPLHSLDKNKLFIQWRDIQVVKDSTELAHRHDYYQLMFLEHAEGQHEIDFETYKANNKSLHFVGKGRVHKVDFKSNIMGGVLLFSEAIFGSSESELKLLSSFTYFKNGAYPIHDLTNADFLSINTLIIQIKEAIQTESFELSKYLLFALLTQVRNIYKPTQEIENIKSEAKELIQFNQLLKEHELKTIEDYTSKIGITSARLNTLCKEQYGQTALQLLHNEKILKAKRMLVYTEKQVKEIAFDCGFEDVAYFNRFFKKHTQCTPLSFRKSH